MAARFESVLVASSLDTDTDGVVRAGLAIGKSLAAHLHLIHALPSVPVYPGPYGTGWSEPKLLEAQRSTRQQSLLQLQEQLRRLGVDQTELASSVIEVGSPHRVALKAAADVAADLIVVGAGRGLPGPILGSTASRILRQSTCPVFIVRGAPAVPPARVVLPVDLSCLSSDALSCGLEFLSRLRGDCRVQLQALFVLTPTQREANPQFTPEQVDRFASEELEHFIGKANPGGIFRVQGRVRCGDIRDVILGEQEDWPADLLVVGTHGRGGFERLIIGSVAEAVARRATCSVLVVPPEAALKAALAQEEGLRRSADWTYVSHQSPAGKTLSH